MKRIKIRDLDITTRTKNTLLRSGIEYLEDMVGVNEKNMYWIKGFGEESLKEIRNAMNKLMDEGLENAQINNIKLDCWIRTYLDEETFFEKFKEWVETHGGEIN